MSISLPVLAPESWELGKLFSVSWFQGRVADGIFLIGEGRFTSATWIPLRKVAIRSWLLKGSLFSLWIIQILSVPGHSDVHPVCILLPIITSTEAGKREELTSNWFIPLLVSSSVKVC